LDSFIEIWGLKFVANERLKCKMTCGNW